MYSGILALSLVAFSQFFVTQLAMADGQRDSDGTVSVLVPKMTNSPLQTHAPAPPRTAAVTPPVATPEPRRLEPTTVATAGVVPPDTMPATVTPSPVVPASATEAVKEEAPAKAAPTGGFKLPPASGPSWPAPQVPSTTPPATGAPSTPDLSTPPSSPFPNTTPPATTPPATTPDKGFAPGVTPRASSGLTNEPPRTAPLPAASTDLHWGATPPTSLAPPTTFPATPPQTMTAPPAKTAPTAVLKTPAKTLLKSTFIATPEETPGLTGQSLSLADSLIQANRPTHRIEVVKAYWTLAVRQMAYRSALNNLTEVARLTQPTETPRTKAVREALVAATQARVRRALLDVVTAQYTLKAKGILTTGETPPLASDNPFAGPYRTNFDALFAGRIAPVAMRRLDAAIPIEFECINVNAAALTRATADFSATVNAMAQQETNIDAAVRSFERLQRQQTTFLDSIWKYNTDIAEFALQAASPSVSRETVVSMLIDTNTTASTTPRSSPSTGDWVPARTTTLPSGGAIHISPATPTNPIRPATGFTTPPPAASPVTPMAPTNPKPFPPTESSVLTTPKPTAPAPTPDSWRMPPNN